MQIDYVKEPVEKYKNKVTLFKEECEVEQNTEIQYILKDWTFPIFHNGVFYDKYIPGFEGIYSINGKGDVLSLEKTIVYMWKGALRTTKMTARRMKPTNNSYHLIKTGETVNMSIDFLRSYCGYEKLASFPIDQQFPIFYKGKKWVCWMDGLENKVAVASDASVLTLPVIAICGGNGCKMYYRHTDETILDAVVSTGPYKRYGKNVSRGKRIFAATMATLKLMKN